MRMSNDQSNQKSGTHKYQGVGDLFKVRQDLSRLRKALYIGVVFTGLVLVWYGVWTAVGHIWPLSEPPVAIIVGVLLLLATGKIKALL